MVPGIQNNSFVEMYCIVTQDGVTGNLKSRPFVPATDSNNDKNCVKLYTIVVMYFCENQGRILTVIQFLLECTDSTDVFILNIINEEFDQRNIT